MGFFDSLFNPSRTLHAIQSIGNFTANPIDVEVAGAFFLKPDESEGVQYRAVEIDDQKGYAATLKPGQFFYATTKDRIHDEKLRYYIARINETLIWPMDLIYEQMDGGITLKSLERFRTWLYEDN